jgi:Calcium-binding EGF domain.
MNCTKDIDECSTDLFLCGEGSCINIPGSYKCDCPDGKCGSQCAEDDPCYVSMCSHVWQLASLSNSGLILGEMLLFTSSIGTWNNWAPA